jgi:hypothetical protein
VGGEKILHLTVSFFLHIQARYIMTDTQTAHDAVKGTLLYIAQEWITDKDKQASAVLAALGIPADATVDDVRAGLALFRLVAADHDLHVWAMAEGGYVVQAQPPVGRLVSAPGASPAAAVNALAAKLEEPK